MTGAWSIEWRDATGQPFWLNPAWRWSADPAEAWRFETLAEANRFASVLDTDVLVRFGD